MPNVITKPLATIHYGEDWNEVLVATVVSHSGNILELEWEDETGSGTSKFSHQTEDVWCDVTNGKEYRIQVLD